MFKYSLTFCTILFIAANIYCQGVNLTVIPKPKEVIKLNDSFSIKDSLISIETSFNDTSDIGLPVNELKNTFKQVKGFSLTSKRIYTRKILLGLPSNNISFRKLCEQNGIWPNKKIGRQGYILIIKKNLILIAANTKTGTYYGVQTLKQIVRGNKNNSSLPGVKIIDYPALKYRGVLDDISRGPIPTISFMKEQIRRLAELKVNMLQYYTENVVLTKSHPEFAPPNGFVSIKEWKYLSNYAKKYHIMLVGNFQSFGHFEKILKTPKYVYLGESGDLLSPLRPASYKFLSDIYSEMVPAFKAPFFNVNCDETFDLGHGRSKRLVDSLGYAKVYYLHMMHLYNILKKLHVKMMMWADIVLKHPELLKMLPKDIILATWTYDPLPSYNKYIVPIKNAGFKFFITTGVLNSNKLYPNYAQTFGNIEGFAKAGIKYGAEGLINATFDEGATSLFSNDWYGIAYGADKSWNSSSQDSIYFNKAFNAGIYEAETDDFTTAMDELASLRKLEPTDGMNDKILFENLLPDSGQHVRISLQGWNKVLEITDKAESLLKNTHLNNYVGDKEDLSFVISLYSALAKERIDLFNAAQKYAEADSVFSKERMKARALVVESLNDICGIIDRFTSIKNEYENVWLKENYMSALNAITDQYQVKIDNYIDVKNRLLNSLDSLDSGGSLLTPQKVRLAISKLPGKYFREWLMINPLPNVDESGNSKIDYLTNMGGQKNAVPSVAMEFKYDSLTYRWRRVVTKYQDVVDLSELFPNGSDDEIMYAFANIDVENDTAVTAAVGCTDGMQVFINGRKIFQSGESNTLIPDQYKFKLPLKKGRNNLLLKISRTGENWGFTLRLIGSEVRNSKNRYRILR